jgi:predicted nucleic acid-binding Zn ribbon protein
MPLYLFRCSSCLDETEFEFPIGTARRLMGCNECGGRAQLVIGAGVQIAPSALEGKGAAVRASNGKDRELDKDMGSYKRMRGRGLQPSQIDGASKLENEVNDGFDIAYKQRLQAVKKKHGMHEPWQATKERVQEGMQEAAT